MVPDLAVLPAEQGRRGCRLPRLGVYYYFNVNSSVVADRAVGVPDTARVALHDAMDVSLGGTGTITHIVNGTGASVRSGSTVANLVSYP